MSDFLFARLFFSYVESSFSRLVPRNVSYSIEEGLSAKTKDPLWYLTRQWQMGEFQAENGGHPVNVEVTSQTALLEKLRYGPGAGLLQEFSPMYDPDMPAELFVEGSSTPAKDAWNDEHLEYIFALSNDSNTARIKADEYFSGDLDWYDFDMEGIDIGADAESIVQQPTKITFAGMPHSRWWMFEDSSIELGDISRPSLNFISMLLMEFSLLYSDNWYMVPLQQVAGSIRMVKSLKVTDSFGTVSQIDPIKDNSPDGRFFSLFTLSARQPYNNAQSEYLFLPNKIGHLIKDEALELVTLARDEEANLVWAVEHKYSSGRALINRDDIEAAKTKNDEKPQNGMPLYRLKSQMPENWIPYVPRYVQNPNGSTSLVLRRGRTVEDKRVVQYKGEFIKDSIVIYDEEVPATPVELTRHYKLVTMGREEWRLKYNETGPALVRKDIRRARSWVAKVKKHAGKQPVSNLKYDYIVEK